MARYCRLVEETICAERTIDGAREQGLVIKAFFHL